MSVELEKFGRRGEDMGVELEKFGARNGVLRVE